MALNLTLARRMTLAPAVPIIAFACVAAVACEPSGGTESPQGEGPEELHLARAGDYPCSLTFQPTGTVLRSDLEGDVPDPDPPVALGPDGRLATPRLYRGEVALWSSEGESLGTVGRVGQGPGELGDTPIPMFDNEGGLHVFDPTQARWSQFTAEGEFLGSLASPHLTNVSLSHNSALMDADSILISAPSPNSAERFQFRVVSQDGSTRGFGDIPDEGNPYAYRRAITQPTGGTFWAAPWDGASEYTFEQWTLDGRVLRRLRREPPWGVADGGSPGPGGTADLPRVVMVAEGPRGELIVLTAVRAPNPSDPAPTAEAWYEVFDPRTRDVLASQQVLFESDSGLPPDFGIGSGPSRLGFQQIRDSLGLATFEMIEYRLTPSDARTDPLTCLP